MATNSQRPRGQGSALSSLDEAINDLKLTKETMEVAPVKAALDSASILLETVRGSRAHKPGYVKLGLSYARVCIALGQGVNQRQPGPLGQPVLKAIGQLTMTAVEVHKNISKQDKRSAISRVFRPNKDQEMINTWLSDLLEIFHVFNTELGPNTPETASATPHDPVDAQIPAPRDRPEIVVPATPDTIARKISDGAANPLNVEHDTHRDENRNDSNHEIPGGYQTSDTENSLGKRKAAGETVEENGRDVPDAKPHESTQELRQDQINPQDRAESQDPSDSDEEEQLRQAIALSLERETGWLPPPPESSGSKGNGNGSAGDPSRKGNADTDGFGEGVRELQEAVDHWTQQRSVLAALGGDVSKDEEPYKAATRYLALLKNHPDGPTTASEALQLKKAQDEFLGFLGHEDDDEELNRVIAESLAATPAADEVEEEIPPEVLERRDNRPAVIRTPGTELAHVGQLWQALYNVPQVRYQISQYCKPSSLEDAPGADHSNGGAAEQVWAVHELFEFMELAGLAVVTGEPSMEQFPRRPWGGISPREGVESAYKDFTERVEVCLNNGVATQRPDWPRLFHSRINGGISQERAAFDTKNDFSFISVEYNDEDGSSDLVGCLTSQGFPKFRKQGSPNGDRTTTEERAAIETADVIAFALAREYQPHRDSATGISQERRKFSFPESFYLDRFATTNRELILEAKVAEDIKQSAANEDPSKEPQPEKYDLRAALMHDGQRGRTHVYSYLRKDDAWWKIVDYTATKVPLEEALNDKNGLHLEAGPFFLIYSRSLSGPLVSEPQETSKSTDPTPVPPESDSESLYAD